MHHAGIHSVSVIHRHGCHTCHCPSQKSSSGSKGERFFASAEQTSRFPVLVVEHASAIVSIILTTIAGSKTVVVGAGINVASIVIVITTTTIVVTTIVATTIVGTAIVVAVICGAIIVPIVESTTSDVRSSV